MKLSMLDQAPISKGKTARDALDASIELAKRGDQLGYERYWIAEHHDMDGLACSNPAVMLGVIGQQTKRIRLGAGAVLLPYYKPFAVAETYNLLATLYPDRIDLGIGRAPGGSAEASMALSDNFLQGVKGMPEALDDLQAFFDRSFPSDHLFSNVDPSPIPITSPVPWMLGTSERSAILAAEKGMPYTFGHFMSEADGPAIVKKYRELVKPDAVKQPGPIVTIAVICAETTEKAEELALSSLLWNVQQHKGESQGVPSIEEAKTYTYNAADLALIKKMKHSMVIGNPTEVVKQIKALQERYEVDEFMIVTITHDYESRLHSYQLIAEEYRTDT